MTYQEGRMFLTPLSFNTDMCRQIYDRGPATGYREQIGSYLKCFIAIEVLYGDTVQGTFCIGSSVENGGAEIYRDPCRHCGSDAGPCGPGPRIINTLHGYSSNVKPKRITIPLVVNRCNNRAPEDP